MAGPTSEQKAWLRTTLGVAAGDSDDDNAAADAFPAIEAAIDARLDWMEEQAIDDSPDSIEFGKYEEPGLADKAIALVAEAYEAFNDRLEGKSDAGGAAAAQRMLTQVTGVAAGSGAAATRHLTQERAAGLARREALAQIGDARARLKAGQALLAHLDAIHAEELKRAATLTAHNNAAARHLDALEGKGFNRKHEQDDVLDLLDSPAPDQRKIDDAIDTRLAWAEAAAARLEQATRDYHPPGFLAAEFGVLKDALKGLAQRIAGHDPAAEQQRKLRLEAYEAATKGSDAEGARQLRTGATEVSSQIGQIRAITEPEARAKASRRLLRHLVRMQDVEAARAAEVAAYIAAEHARAGVEAENAKDQPTPT